MDHGDELDKGSRLNRDRRLTRMNIWTRDRRLLLALDIIGLGGEFGIGE